MLFTRRDLNILILSSLAILTASQAVILLAAVLARVPCPSVLFSTILPEWQDAVRPKWDIWLYILFIAISVGYFVVSWIRFASRISDEATCKALCRHLAVEGVLTFLMASAAFKLVIYDNSPWLAQWSLYVLSAIAIAYKIFGQELHWLSKKAMEQVNKFLHKFPTSPWINALCLLIIVLVIYLPDTKSVVAFMFIGECVHHFDFFIMSPGWASLHGHLPYVGVMSQYGLGVPLVWSYLAKLTGGFDYVHVLNMFMWFVIAYYILVYLFVRQWLGRISFGMMAFLLAFRLQMLHYGVSPLVWTTPSSTPLRFGLDIVWLLCLLMHLRSSRNIFLLAAGCYSGFAIFYMSTTGLCLALSYYFYLVTLWFVPYLRRYYFDTTLKRWYGVLAGVLPAVVATGLFAAALGKDFTSPLFWKHLTEYITFFSHGHAGGVLPIYESLKYRHFWASLMGFVMPLTFLATFMYLALRVWQKKENHDVLIVLVLCVYGLVNYQYFVVRSAVTTYYVGSLPFVFISIFWLWRWIMALPQQWHQRILALALVLSAYALVTNHNYISYPNTFNFSRNPLVDPLVIQKWPDRQGYFNHMFKNIPESDKIAVNDQGNTQEDIRTEDNFKTHQELTEYFKAKTDFTTDVALIDRLTAANDQVAVLSSFETMLLIKANRGPFFYHIPLISSRPMGLRNYPADAAHSPNFLAECLGQLKLQKPRYIFMEKVFLQDKIPQTYLENNANIVGIVKFIKEHYSAAVEGEYLVAMQRNGE